MHKIIQLFRGLFKTPTPLEMAMKEYVEAEHQRLIAQTGAEYALSQVQYNDKRIARLSAYIKGHTND